MRSVAPKQPAAPAHQGEPLRNGAAQAAVEAPAVESAVIDRSFAQVRSVHIVDSDPDRAQITEALLKTLASELGIRVDQIDLRVDGTNARARGGGVMEAGVVHLDPTVYDPTSRRGRRMLAHEVTHVAQRLQRPRAMGRKLPPLAVLAPAAELEAERTAHSFAELGMAAPARVPLGREASAGLASFDKSFAELSATVRKSHEAEIDEVTSLMSYGAFDWAVTDADVEEALHILATVPMLVARAIAANIGAKYRRRLIDNLSPQHYTGHKTEILAVVWAAEGDGDTVPEWSGLEDKILNPLPLLELDELESAAVAFAVARSSGVREALLSKPEQAARVREIEAVAQSPEAGAKLDELAAKELEAETAAVAAKKVLLAELEDLAKEILGKLDEWVVTDKEALTLLDHIADRLLGSIDPAPKFRALANALGDEKLDELIDQIPTKGLYQSEKRRSAFVQLLSMRPPFKNEQVAEELIDSPWWKFWDAYTSEEAFLAWLLVKSMPPRARNAFFAAHGGAEWSRITGKLPLNIRESDTLNFYTGGEKDKDRQSILVQLLDDELWTKAKKDKLLGVIRMANAAGQAEFVFEQSKAHRADQTAGLEDIVTKFELYSEKDKRTTFTEKPLEGAPFWDEHILGFFGMLGASLDFIFSSDNVDVDTFAIGGEGLNLAEFQDIMGGSFMGARFSRTPKEERKAVAKANKGKEDKDKALATNSANARWNIDTGQLTLHADALALDKLAYPIGDMRLTSGPAHINKIDVYISYMPEAHLLRSLELSIGHLDLDGVVFTMADSMVALNRVSVDGLKVTLRAADQRHLYKSVPGAEGAGMVFSNLWNVIMGTASPDLSTSLTKPGWAMELMIDFTSLSLEGITTSGGQFIQKVDIGGFFMHAGGDSGTYKQALTESRLRVQARIDEETPLAAAEKEPDGPHKLLLARLQRQLTKISGELAENKPAGAVIDVAKVSISGMEGVTKGDKPLELSDIHGQGRSVTSVMPLLTDSTTIRNLLVGEQAIPSVKGRRPADDSFSIDIGRIHAEDLSIAGGIPTLKDAQRDYDRFIRNESSLKTKPGYQVIADVLAARVQQVSTYEELGQEGVQHLQGDKLARFREARDWLLAFEKKRATVIKQVTLENASFVVDADGQAGLDADSLLIDNIQTFSPDGSPSLQIQQISATQISARATLTGGLVNYKEWRKRLEHGEATAKSLTLTGIENMGTGAAIEKLTFESGDTAMPGLHATLDTKGGASTATVQSGKVTASGVSIPAYSVFLKAELDRLTALPVSERSAEQSRRIDTIQGMLTDLEGIRQRKSDAEALLATKPEKKVRESAEKELAWATKDFTAWERKLRIEKLTIDQLSVSLSGLGDVLSEDYDFDKDATGLTVSGTGKDGHWFEKAEVSGARSGTGPKDEIYVEDATMGPIKGDLTRIENGWALKKFQVPSITVDGIHYVSGTTSVNSTGRTVLSDIELTADVTSDKLATQVALHELKIGAISAKGLRYEDDSVVVTISTGEFQTVRVEEMLVTMPEDPTQQTVVEGTLTVDRVKKLAVNASVAGYNVAAELKSDAPVGAKPAKAISVTLGKAGLEEIDLTHLSGGLDVTQPGSKFKNKIHVDWKYLSASIGHSKTKDGEGDIWNIKHLSIGDLTAPKGSHWESDKFAIDFFDSVKLSQVFADARVETGKDAKGESHVVSAVINGLTVEEIDAKEFEVLLKAQEATVDKKGKKIPASTQKRLHLTHGTISQLKMTGFDLLNRTGKIEVLKDINVEKLKVTIGDETKGAVQKGTVSFQMHGKDSDAPGMGGRELSATLRTDGGKTIQLGTIESITGEDIEGDLTAKMIKTGKVTTGPVDITGNTVTVPDIEIASIEATSKATYKDGKGGTVEVDDAKITGIHLPMVVAEFNDEGLSRIRLGGNDTEGSMLIIDEIVGNGFFYQSPGVTEDKKGTTNTEVRARHAELTTFKAGNIERDFVAKVTKFQGGLKSAKLDGFSLLLAETVGGAESSKLFAADVVGSELRADLSLEDAASHGKPWVNGRSTFELDKLGLTNIAYTTVEGKTALSPGEIMKIQAQTGKTSDATVTGLKTHFTPDGGAFVAFDDLAAHNLALSMPGVEASLDTAELHDFVFGLKGAKLEKGKQQLAAKIGGFHFEGLNVQLDETRHRLSAADAEKAAKASAAAPKWMLEPLGSSDADINVVYRYGKDHHATLPVRGGSIDFDDVSNPTYGVFATLGVDADEIYVDLPVKGRTEIYSPPHGAGLTPETTDDLGPDNSTRITDRGAVNLQEMIEAAMNEPTSATPEDPASLAALNDVGITTNNFRLGKGKFGQGNNFIELDAQTTGREEGTAADPNTFTINSVNIGNDLTLHANLFKARRGHFEFKDKKGTTGAIQITDFTITVSNLGGPNVAATGATPVFRFGVTIHATDGTIDDIQWGDVEIIKPDKSGLTGEPAAPAKGSK